MEIRTLPKTRGRHPPPKRMATALVRDEQNVVGSRSSAGTGGANPHRERGGAEQVLGGTMAPRPAHTAAPRVKEHNPPSLAASEYICDTGISMHVQNISLRCDKVIR